MLDSVVIEVRQHVCCANIFLKFKQPLRDMESLKIATNKAEVKLQYHKYSAELLVDRLFTITSETACNVIMDAENASFRINITGIKLTENNKSIKGGVTQINLAEQDDAALICSNCGTDLAVQQKYDKIREFPSGTVDISDFFCHHGPNFKDVLVPSKTNLFYGFQFIVINRSNIENSIFEKENHIYCRRCSKYLGEIMFDCRAAKLWCDSIRLNSKGKILKVFPLDEEAEIYKLILKAIEETSLPSPEPLLRNMHFTNVLFKTSSPNRQQQYLLLHIMEKHLPVFISKEMIQREMIFPDQNPNFSIEFQQKKAFKILYRLITKDDNTNKKNGQPTVLESWKHDINILKMTISPFLFSALYEELNKNMYILPKLYRANSDNFLLSYIFY